MAVHTMGHDDDDCGATTYTTAASPTEQIRSMLDLMSQEPFHPDQARAIAIVQAMLQISKQLAMIHERQMIMVRRFGDDATPEEEALVAQHP